MAFKFTCVALILLQMAIAMPSNKPNTLDDLMMVDDTAAVGSYIRETRAAPDDWHKSEEHEGDGVIGFSRKKSGGGKKGYQHFDSYHKKAGDNYEFEKQDSFGLDDKGQDGAYSHNHERRAKKEQEYEPEHEFERYEEEEEHPRKKAAKQQQKGRHFEELKQGADDGNGGVEAFGHDTRDYILPEKYTWGEEDDV